MSYRKKIAMGKTLCDCELTWNESHKALFYSFIFPPWIEVANIEILGLGACKRCPNFGVILSSNTFPTECVSYRHYSSE